MKKISYFALAVLAAFALSCTPDEPLTPDDPNKDQTEEPSGEEDGEQDEEGKEDEENKEEEQEEAKTVVLAVSAPADITAGPLTKTVMLPAGEGYAVNWTASDEITVNGLKPTAKEVDASDAKKASFTFENLTAPYCAAYPASAATAFVGTGATVILPSEQKYTESSFDPAAAVMLAYAAEGETLAFSHAMSYLYLTVSSVSSSDNIMSVTVSTKGNEPLCGAFSATFGADGCSLKAVDGNASTSVSLDCGETGVAMGTPMVVAVPAGTYASGIVVKVTDASSGVTTLTAEEELVLQAGNIYTAELQVVAQGIYDLAGYEAFAADVNAGDYSAWVNPADGEVNLYADLTSEVNYTYISSFDGVFDGNGHTMTCEKKSRPLFNTLSSTAVVKNLTTAGTYVAFENQGEQAFASFARVNLGHIYKCTNDTDCSKIESVQNAIVFGGFVGQNGGVIEECVNNADITLNVPATDKMACFGGGFAAYGHSVIGFQSAASLNVDGTCSAGKFIKCVNNGDISVTVTSGYIARASFGGVCGMVIMNGVEFTGCENSGKIYKMSSGEDNTGADPASTLGGICGRSVAWFVNNVEAIDAAAANLGGFNTRFSGCRNSGELTLGHRNDRNLQAENINRDDYVGGIVGAAVGLGSSTPVIEDCTLEAVGKVLAGFNANNTSHTAGGIAGLATNAAFSGCNVYGEIGSNGTNCVATAGGVAGLTIGTVSISGGVVKPVLTPVKSGQFSLSYGILVGSAFNNCVLTAEDVACGGSVSVGGSDMGVDSSNFNDYLCKNVHFTTNNAPTFTNCTWAD